jgi:hypothetical protein
MMHVDAMRPGLRRRFRDEIRDRRRAERQRAADQEIAAIEARLVRETAIAKREPAA